MEILERCSTLTWARHWRLPPWRGSLGTRKSSIQEGSIVFEEHLTNTTNQNKKKEKEEQREKRKENCGHVDAESQLNPEFGISCAGDFVMMDKYSNPCWVGNNVPPAAPSHRHIPTIDGGKTTGRCSRKLSRYKTQPILSD